jgi:flagellar motor switch/type III secretory pathway protein FliN
MGTVRDFPWGSLDRLRRSDLDAIRGLRAALAGLVAPRAALEALAAHTKARVSVRLRKTITTVPDLAAGDVGVLLAPADAPETSRAVFVAVEGLLAATLVARALEQKPPRIADASAPAAPALTGAFAALLVRAARRDAGTPLRVLAAGSAAGFARDLANAAGSFVGASFTALVDDDAFLAHVLLPRARANATSRLAELDRAALARMGPLPLAVPIVAATFTLATSEVAALRIGDVVLVPREAWPLANGAGAIALAAPRSEVGVAAQLEELGTGPRVVLGGEVRSLPWSAPNAPEGDAPMTDRDPLAEAVGEVPVVLRVELGTAELSARQWAELGPGDVVTVGRRVKEPVTIRVSGVEVARGELVDVDSEVGVRIVSLAKERTS